jgi:hypothetical protein
MLTPSAREGFLVCRARWLVGVTVREYREMKAGDRVPEFDVWDLLCELRAAKNRRDDAALGFPLGPG